MITKDNLKMINGTVKVKSFFQTEIYTTAVHGKEVNTMEMDKYILKMKLKMVLYIL